MRDGAAGFPAFIFRFYKVKEERLSARKNRGKHGKFNSSFNVLF